MIRRLLIAFLFLLVFIPVFSNDDCYLTQVGTGQGGNCGPASVAMACRWYNNEAVTVETVREIIGNPRPGGGTSLSELFHALEELGTPSKFTKVYNVDDIERIFVRGNIAIVLYYPKLIYETTYNDPSVGRNYPFSDANVGHYSVVKDDVAGIYFVLNDPMPKWGRQALFQKELV